MLSVSSSRLTLLPSSRVGSRDLATLEEAEDGSAPDSTAARRLDSKSTLPARKLGVWMLAMLFATVRWRSDSPLRAVCSALIVASPMGSVTRPPDRSCNGTAPRTPRRSTQGPPVRGDGGDRSVVGLYIGRRTNYLRLFPRCL